MISPPVGQVPWTHCFVVALAIAAAGCSDTASRSGLPEATLDGGGDSGAVSVGQTGGEPDGGRGSEPDGSGGHESDGGGSIARRPNVVFLLADDLGLGDLGTYGHPYAQTPNLDRLAAEGTKFTRFHVTGAVCNPSRTGFMTGRHPRSFAQPTKDFGFGGRPTVTSLVKNAGYRTGHCGKWHIGPSETNGTYGIDSIRTSFEGNGAPGPRDQSVYECAMEFVTANKDAPFYLNVWGHSTHFPVDPDPSLTARFADLKIDESKFGPYMKEKFDEVRALGGDPNVGMRNYLADVYGLDSSVGRLLAKLDELGLIDNTIVVFSSDHGPAPVGSGTGLTAEERRLKGNMLGWARGLRGGKHGDYEGGVTSAWIVRWPGHVPKGAVNEASVLSALDWLPTIASIVGAKIPDNIEGQDVSDLWLGANRIRETPLFWNTRPSTAAMLNKNWKLFMHNDGARELYDLSKDPTESKNLWGTNAGPDKSLERELVNWTNSLPPQTDFGND